MKHEKYGNYGYIEDCGKGITYEIIKKADQAEIDADKESYGYLPVVGLQFTYKNYTVAAHGQDNRLPNNAVTFIRNNPYLPEILKKQVRMLYGKGPYLFTEEIKDEKITRIPVSDKYPQVFAWLDGWQNQPDLDPAPAYFKRCMFEYYYNEQLYNQYLFNASRRVAGRMPVRGLKVVNGVKCRLAHTGLIDSRLTIEREMLDSVLVGNWDAPYTENINVYPLFNPARPFANYTAINHVADRGFDEDIYALPTSYYGLREWIRGANLNPKYINSYLKNSLAARIHIKIPNSWIELKTKTLQEICEKNQELELAGETLITSYDGITTGTRFSYQMVEKLINNKLKEAVAVLSGEGENQGKTFWSRTFAGEHGLESWEFVEIPTKYKEFIESVIEYDKRALSVILAGKGLDPAISNVTNEGVFNSGSEVYYNYLLYLDNLTYAEEFVTHDINNALWLNFPELAAARVRLGFFRYAPERQQETNVNNRLEKNV